MVQDPLHKVIVMPFTLSVVELYNRADPGKHYILTSRSREEIRASIDVQFLYEFIHSNLIIIVTKVYR